MAAFIAPPLADEPTDLQVADVCDIARTGRTLWREAIEDTTEQDRPFELLSLPPEIWIKICKLAVLCDEATLWLDSWTGDAPHRNILPGPAIPKHPMKPGFKLMNIVHQPGITQTCRMIRNEILPSFYNRNKFIGRIDRLAPAFLYKWLDAIGTANRRHIRLFVRECQERRGCRSSHPPAWVFWPEQEGSWRRMAFQKEAEAMQDFLQRCFGDYDDQLECNVEGPRCTWDSKEGKFLEALLVGRERSGVQPAE